MSPTPTLNSYEPMPLHLDIPENDRYRLLMERTPKSHEQQSSDSAVPEPDLNSAAQSMEFMFNRKTRLSETHCAYMVRKGHKTEILAGGQEFATQLARVMASDKSGQLPATVKWHASERKRTMRDNAERRIRENDSFQDLVRCLDQEGWIRWLSGPGCKLSAKDLLPIRDPHDYDSRKEVSMVGLARELDSIVRATAQTQEAGVRNELEEYCCLALDLGEAATQCSDMKTFVCISFYLFWVAAKVWDPWVFGCELGNIGHKYLSNYVALVLLGEAIEESVGKENAETPE